MKNILSLLILLQCFSCYELDEQSVIDRDKNQKYFNALHKISLNCNGELSENQFTAYVNNTLVCYYENSEIEPLMVKGVTFTTRSPNFGTNIEYDNVKNYVSFGIQPKYGTSVPYHGYIEFETPLFKLTETAEHFLDSIFAIKEHLLRSIDDETDKFKVTFEIDVPSFANSYLVYTITTARGDQKDSKLIVKKFNKGRDDLGLYYDIEIELDCTLYHSPEQHTVSGVWSRIRSGKLSAQFRPKFF